MSEPIQSAKTSENEPPGNERVLVFCASSQSADPVFRESAADLGRRLAQSGRTVVYGGGALGSMGALADGALAEGGNVVGIQPRFLAERFSA